MALSGGRVVVTSPGTPVQISQSTVKCHAVMIQALPTNAGTVYGGVAPPTFVKGVSGEIFFLGKPGTDQNGKVITIPSFSETISSAMDGLNLADYWIDADNGGDGVLVSYTVW